MALKTLLAAALALPILAAAQGLPPAGQMLGSGSPAAVQPLTVRIGHVAPLSGVIAHLGKDNERGAAMAISNLNAAALVIQGRPVRWELVTGDDGADPRMAVDAAYKMVDAKVHGVVGHLNSGATIPAALIYHEAGIPQITPSATNPKLTRLGYPGVFRLVADDDTLGNMLGKVAVERLKGQQIMVIDDRTAYGAGIADSFSNGVRAAGGTVAARAYLPEQNRDYRRVAAIAKERRPDVIFYGGMDTEAADLLRELQRAGVDAMLVGGDGVCTTELGTLAGRALKDERLICAEAGGIGLQERAVYERFTAEFRSRYSDDVVVYAPYTYDAVMTLANAMKLADSIEPKGYLPALRRANYSGVTGPIAFDDKGDPVKPAITLSSYRGGKRFQVAIIR